MNKLMELMEKKFAPAMNKVNSNIWIVTLKDSINQVMPLIFVGSIFSMLTLPGEAFGWTWWPDFWTPNGWTLGVVSLMMAFLIPFNLMEKSRLRKMRIVAGMGGLILFMIAVTPQLIADEAVGFAHSAFGAGGMFIAIVTGIITGLIMRAFGKFTFFKEDSALPDFIRQWFDQLLPVATIVILGWVTIQLLGFDLYNLVLSIFMPLQGIVETPFGFILIELVTVFLYSMGISVWVLTPITTPVMLAGITANAAGAANLYTNSTVYAYLGIGGAGSTIVLAIMLLLSQSKRLKALGRAVIAPSIFNINEPVVFGAIAWNPLLMIPMWIVGIVSPAIVFLLTKVIPFAPVPVINFQLWYMPFPFCTWLASGGAITAILLALIVLGAAALIYFPFFKVYEKQCLAEEQAELEAKAAA